MKIEMWAEAMIWFCIGVGTTCLITYFVNLHTLRQIDEHVPGLESMKKRMEQLRLDIIEDATIQHEYALEEKREKINARKRKYREENRDEINARRRESRRAKKKEE